MEARIATIENTLKSARIIDDSEIDTETVSIGVTVKLSVGGMEVSYKIVPTNDADPANGMISNESPVGAALVGKTIGDTVSVETPSGEVEYTILEISRDF